MQTSRRLRKLARGAFGLLPLALGLLPSCTTSAAPPAPFDQPTVQALFGPTFDTVSFEVDYAAGAEPYTGNVGGKVGFDIWDLFTSNAQRLFQSAHKSLLIPTTLAQMEELDDVTAASFTTDQILAIADQHRGSVSAGSVATFYVLWLPGYYDDGSQPQTDVLGLSLGDTGIIALFKPVIESTNSGGAQGLSVAMFVEQSTLVHELGHAVGLVDNGAPLTAQHLDTGHGAHCTDEACVMYYANEGATAAKTFVGRIAHGTDILFDADCLGDVDALAAASAAGQ
jgi:hypothetical protein